MSEKIEYPLTPFRTNQEIECINHGTIKAMAVVAPPLDYKNQMVTLCLYCPQCKEGLLYEVAFDVWKDMWKHKTSYIPISNDAQPGLQPGVN